MTMMSRLGFDEEDRTTEQTFDFSGISKSSSPEVEAVTEASFNAQEVTDLAKVSLDFLAGLAMPLIYKYAFPPVFLAVWSWLLSYVHKERDFSQLALGLPRGFGKTSLMKLFLLFCILFTKRTFILVVCENTTKAVNIISDVMDMLEEPNIKKVFGDWKIGVETDRQDLKKFGFRGRNIIIMAAGADSGIRGIVLKNQRPDIMLFDDIQSRELANSEVQSSDLEAWMIGTAMKAKSPHGCLFLFTGNMYPTKWSILRKLKHNPNWIKFIAGGILANGESLWEELQPIEQLLKEYENDLSMGRPEIFYAEVLNDETASSNNLIDLKKLPPVPYEEGDLPAGNFIIIDPASGKINSDAVAIGYFEVYGERPCLRKLTNKRLSPGDTIRISLQYALEHNCRLIAIESVAYQSTLKYWFDFICLQMGIVGIEAVEVYPGGTSKNSRILSMFKAYQSGDVFVDKSVVGETHLQIMQFNPLRRDNIDDVLDLLAYAPKVLELYGEYIVTTTQINTQDNSAVQILPPELNCAF